MPPSEDLHSLVLHDLLFALLGFPGDIIISEIDCAASQQEVAGAGRDCLHLFQPGTFRMKDGYPEISDAERDQINRLVPLGRYYLCFSNYAKHYMVGWRRDRQPRQLYRLALASALRDLLQEYEEDIGELEVVAVEEACLPFSHLLQFLQKVSRSRPSSPSAVPCRTHCLPRVWIVFDCLPAVILHVA